jgi:hypothetical protein
MSIIKRPAEIVGKETIAALIYGQPGMGKTTLACSAPKPVLFDFDGGIDRVRLEHQVPTVQISKWEDAEAALKEIESAPGEFKTIIVDTASKMIDCIIFKICGTAQPKIQQWGLINAEFKAFLRSVQQLRMNVVFVAQRESEKNGEEVRQIPQFRASNYKDVICDLDVCGYMEMVVDKGQQVRMITFNPTSRNEGKNTADFEPAYFLPTLAPGQPNNFLTDRFAEFVERQRNKAKQRADIINGVNAKVEMYKSILGDCKDANDVNTILEKAKAEEAVGDLRLRLAQLIKDRATALNLKLNKETNRYE